MLSSVLLRAGIPEVEAGCPGLQSINVNGCVTLFRLALEQQPLLERMEASGCKALRHAVSSSSVLRACFLQSCPRLVVSLCSTVPEGHFSELQVMLAIVGANLPGTNQGTLLVKGQGTNLNCMLMLCRVCSFTQLPSGILISAVVAT